MARRRSEVDAEFQQLYARVPSSNCKGLCAEFCSGKIFMSPVERRKLTAAGVKMPRTDTQQDNEPCPALDVFGRCTAYDARPLICRMWGSVENMPCPHGCVPDGGHLPVAAGRAIVQRSIEVGGSEQ